MLTLTRCRRDFSEFWRALNGTVCPLCAVLSAKTTDLVESAADFAERIGGKNPPETILLCDHHLSLTVRRLEDSRARAKLLRSIVSTPGASRVHAGRACPVCTSLEGIAAALTRLLRRLDSSTRFQDIIQGAPIFCLCHRAGVDAQNAAPHFSRIQQTKLDNLVGELAKAERGIGFEADRTINQTLRYLVSERS